MSRYVVSPAARVDLDQIWDYTCERWDAKQAEKYIREIQRAIERITDYRKHAVGSHTLYYRITDTDLINVVRILHQRMDVDRHLD